VDEATARSTKPPRRPLDQRRRVTGQTSRTWLSETRSDRAEPYSRPKGGRPVAVADGGVRRRYCSNTLPSGSSTVARLRRARRVSSTTRSPWTFQTDGCARRLGEDTPRAYGPAPSPHLAGQAPQGAIPRHRYDRRLDQGTRAAVDKCDPTSGSLGLSRVSSNHRSAQVQPGDAIRATRRMGLTTARLFATAVTVGWRVPLCSQMRGPRALSDQVAVGRRGRWWGMVRFRRWWRVVSRRGGGCVGRRRGAFGGRGCE
jgi:hypothetical protein